MQKFLVTLVIVSLAANVYLGFVAANHLSLIEELEAGQEDVDTEISDLEVEVSAQESVLGDLKDRPAVNAEALAGTLSTLQSDLDALSGEVGDVSFRLGDVEYQIERPFGCSAGDPVFWASGFRGGLTC